MKEIKLFDYQQEMLEDIIEAFSTAAFDSVFYDEKGKKVNVGSSVMVQMPTGTGKTYVMAAVVKCFLYTHDKSEVWLIAHRQELVEQAEPKRQKMTGAQLGKYKQSIEPFISEDGSLMGLKTPDEVVMKPKYRHISKFHGDYAVFCLNTFGWQRGVINRLGYVVIPAEDDDITRYDN